MVGFDAEESLLPLVRRSMDGHRLLQEYFALPEKFLFFDLRGWSRWPKPALAKRRRLCFCSRASSAPSASRCWNWA
jgi:type VI protein secretion system component VasA